MSHARSFVRLVSLVALGLSITGTAAAAAEAPVPAGPACDATLPLVWIDGGRRASRAVLDEAEREASRIWAPAGITFDWARSTPARAIRADEVLVMVRERLAGRPRIDLTSGRHTLGRVILVSPDRPSRLIELLLPAVATSVHSQTLFGRPIRDLPAWSRERALGRALGRVLAHEIGHWLFGREHTPNGLMRAAIARRDLVDPIPPALPDAWPSSARTQLQARRRACAPSCPVPQPVTSKGTVSCL